jgi:hypothetical protein
MSVLKKFDKKELTARQKAEELSFRARINGISAMTAQESTRYNTGASLVKGAIEAILCTSLHSLLPTFVEKQAQGYTLYDSLDVTSVGPVAFEFFMVRPEADIQSDLIEVFAQVEAAYRGEIESYNSGIVDREIELQLARELRLEEKQRVEAEQERRTRIANEVKTALGATQ